MAWSWSHTAEGMQNVRNNIALLPNEDLVVIYAEWKACDHANRKTKLESAIELWDGEDEDVTVGDLLRKQADDDDSYDSNAFDSDAYDKAFKEAGEGNMDLAEYIAERAEQAATCDNGGFNAWVCPSGCHTVPFDADSDDDTE